MTLPGYFSSWIFAKCDPCYTIVSARLNLEKYIMGKLEWGKTEELDSVLGIEASDLN